MITNKDIRVENGNLVLNGDKFPLDGQSPEAIMEIVEDNSDTTPTVNSTAPVTSGGVFTALAGKEDTISLVNFVDVTITWPETGTDREKVHSIATQVLTNLSNQKSFNMIAVKDGGTTLAEIIYTKISSGNNGVGIFFSYYINGIYRFKNANGTVTVAQLADVS